MADILSALAEAASPEACRDLLQQAGPPDPGLAPQIQALAVACLYSDPERAARLVEAGRQFANLTSEPLAEAYALRGEAHLAYVRGRHSEAADIYGEAAGRFAKLEAESEEARTLSSGLQSLIYLGRYDQAHQWAETAERIFLRHNDALRLARLDSNVGNIYFRQDKPREAVTRYERALETLTELGDDKDVAAVLNNLVVSHTSLGCFREALASYERAQDHCRTRNLAPLSAQADYNIAYLHFLRGEYAEARQFYQRSREVCERSGDAYHLALCDLDESELSLELNLTSEGEATARRAAASFEELGMRYEQAKALVNMAVAASQSRDLQNADRLLRRARTLFTQEGNRVWPALIDLLCAVVAFHGQRYATAQRLSASAWDVLATTMIPSRAAHCQLLLARLWLRTGQADRARAVGREAVARLGDNRSPSLLFHFNLLEGEVNEMQGRWPQALASYEAARRELEDLRGRLDTEDLRISMLKDKLAVYESIVFMCLDSPLLTREDGRTRALLMVQQAKSRSLADRLLHPGFHSSIREPDAPAEALRHELNWHYRQIELAALLERGGLLNSKSAELRKRASEIEAELLELQSRASPDTLSPVLAPAETLPSLLEMVPEGCAVLEYFEARGILSVFVLRSDRLEVVRLGSSAPVRQSIKFLQFQLGRFPLRAQDHGASAGLDETLHHLRELYTQVIRPVEGLLQGCGHLVFAPHRHLHGLPFAALLDRGQALMDRFTISVTPSASVYAACRRRTAATPSGAVVMGVPDPFNPHIENEVRAIAKLIPGARLFLGNESTREVFHREAANAGILHLAAHGFFRRDNPMFSSIQLADGRVTLIDLASARLNVGLLTLSACSSGVSVPVGGDELLGLMRGFLAAGARRMLVSLWEVDDAATSEFMRAFYGKIGGGVPVEVALQSAMAELRLQYPHPYHWAPFVLVGDVP